MKEKIKTICLVFITFAIVVSTIFYCWNVWKTKKLTTQQLPEEVENKCKEECVYIPAEKGGFIFYEAEQDFTEFKRQYERQADVIRTNFWRWLKHKREFATQEQCIDYCISQSLSQTILRD